MSGQPPRRGSGSQPRRGDRTGTPRPTGGAPGGANDRASKPASQLARDRRAIAADRDERVYERKRATQARKRSRDERASFDPAPPGDEDWTVAEEETDGLVRVTPPTQLDQTLRELIERRGWGERLRGASAWARWDEIVGADLAARCEPLRLVRGVLTIRAESQVWATQLRYMIPQLRTNVESVLGEGTVRDVKIVVGPLEGRDRPNEE